MKVTAHARRRKSRWSQFKAWTRVTAEREFVSIALPLTAMWATALFVVLGWDGVKAVYATVWHVFF